MTRHCIIFLPNQIFYSVASHSNRKIDVQPMLVCWYKKLRKLDAAQIFDLIFSEGPEFPVRTARKCKDDILQGTLTSVQCCFLQEIHKSNCCFMISYHTRGQNCSKQADMEEDWFRTTRTTRTWMWAVYIFYVPFFWNLNRRGGRHQTSRSCGDFLAFARLID